MLKAYFRFLSILLLVTVRASAQPSDIFSIRKYPPFNTVDNLIGRAKANGPAKLDSISLLIIKPADAEQITAAGLANRVFNVDIDKANELNIAAILKQLVHFPKLTYLKITGAKPKPNSPTYELPANIRDLKGLKEIEFAYTNEIDMDDALKKLIPMRHLRKLVFTDYGHQLSTTLLQLRQIKDIIISAENIGGMNISNAPWHKAEIQGYHVQYKLKPYFTDGGPLQAQGLISVSKVKALRDLKMWIYQLSDTTVLSKFTQVSTLKIDGILIQSPTVFDELGKLTNLKKLSVAVLNRNKPILLGGLKNLIGLIDLNLKIDYLNGPPAEQLDFVTNLKKLESLRLYFYDTEYNVPDVFHDMPRLKTILLTSVNSVPLSLFNLPGLTKLTLLGNLTQLPVSEKYGCLKLETLNLGANHLTELPQAIKRLPNLQNINVAYNQITDAGDGWQDLKHLKKVDFAGNKLTKFPTGLEFNKSVEWISVHENRITTLPNVKVGNYRLKRLILSGNPFLDALK